LSAASISLIVYWQRFDSFKQMTNWKALAQAARPPVPEELLPEIVPALENLEAALERLEQRLSLDTLPWPAEDEA
jgi:hypothetical protein